MKLTLSLELYNAAKLEEVEEKMALLTFKASGDMSGFISFVMKEEGKLDVYDTDSDLGLSDAGFDKVFSQKIMQALHSAINGKNEENGRN